MTERGARPLLRSGSAGDAVRDLQDRLRGLDLAIPDDELGTYGAATESAVRTFQTVRGIRVDGVCGPETWTTVLDSGYRLGDRLLVVRRPMLRGDDVADLQSRLNALGFDAGKEDGILGPDTERALFEFQRNVGITVDGVCGRETIEAFERVGSKAGGEVAVARERDALRDPQGLAGRRVYVTAGTGLVALADDIMRGLLDAGAAAVLDLSTADESELAASANGYAADLFVSIRPRSDADGDPHGPAECRCCYYASGNFHSETGHAIATAVAAAIALEIGGSGAACGRAYTVLRETRMTALVCEPVVEGDDAALRALAERRRAVASATVQAIRDVLERPGER